MGRAWEKAACFFFSYIRGWTWAEYGKRLPFSSSALLEARHGWVWEEAAFFSSVILEAGHWMNEYGKRLFLLSYNRGWTSAEYGKRLPFSSSLIRGWT
jgi:hypothetical protein